MYGTTYEAALMNLHLKGQGKCERITTRISFKLLTAAYSDEPG
jgi:hypothetical protein